MSPLALNIKIVSEYSNLHCIPTPADHHHHHHHFWGLGLGGVWTKMGNWALWSCYVTNYLIGITTFLCAQLAGVSCLMGHLAPKRFVWCMRNGLLIVNIVSQSGLVCASTHKRLGMGMAWGVVSGHGATEWIGCSLLALSQSGLDAMWDGLI